jgi:hypothetical protein
MFLNGARLEALFPVSTLIVGVGLNVTFMSYAGQMVIGVTANGSALPEVESLGRFVEAAYASLEAATLRRSKRRAGSRRAVPRRRAALAQ